MKRLFYLGVLIVVTSLICVTLYAGDNKIQWENICPNSKAAAYCENVGKEAYTNNKKSPGSRSTRLGKIMGVIWREKGTIIDMWEHKTKTSPQDAYYYIIEDYLGDAFLRPCNEVDAK